MVCQLSGNELVSRTQVCSVAAVTLLLMLFLPLGHSSETIVFPPGADVFDVVRDGGIDNTGQTDVADALQAIFDARGRNLQVMYFPKGTYLLGKGVHMKIDRSRSSKSHSHGPYVVGESMIETVFRLKDGTWTEPLMRLPSPERLTGSKAEIKKQKRLYYEMEDNVVFSTGDCTNTTFNKVARNFTINIGRNNAGAVAMVYNTSNTGCLSDVRLVSEDGRGHIGLALVGSENGPGQIRDIFIDGFDTGIHCTAHYHYACTDVTMRNISRIGIHNRGYLAMEDVTIRMRLSTLPAVMNNHKRSSFAAIGLTIEGQSESPAIRNLGLLYLRNARAKGFAGLLKAGEDTIEEYGEGAPVAGLFQKTGRSLHLPIKKEPRIPWETDLSKWTSPLDYGGVGDNKADDTEAVQKALNAPGKTHVYFPYRIPGKEEAGRAHFKVTETLTVGMDVQRIVGTIGFILSKENPDARLAFEPSDTPVIIEMMGSIPPLLVDNDRTVILRSARPGYKVTGLYLNGAGDVFLSDVHNSIIASNPAQRIWLRHYNNESGHKEPVPLQIEAGRVWLLGWKSENLVQRALVKEQGALEIFGFDNFSVSRKNKDGNWPMFEVQGGQFSVCALSQHGREGNDNLVWETRNGETRKLTKKENGDSDLAIYSGYVPDAVASDPAVE